MDRTACLAGVEKIKGKNWIGPQGVSGWIDKAKTNRLQIFDFSNFVFKVGVQIKGV
jgi:hypothetical protein